MRRGLAAWLGLAVLLATVFAVYAFQHSVAAVGRPAPGFSLPASGGAEVSLGGLRGRVVLLEFWASWCTVCQQEAPALQDFAQRYGAVVSVVGVDWREPQAALTAWVTRFGLTYPNLRDASGVVAQHYGLTGVPETWWITASGLARAHLIGPSTFEQLQAGYTAVTGRRIDGAGVGAVPAGAAATALAVAGGRLWVAVSGGGLWSRPLAGGAWSAAPVAGVQALAGSGSALLAAGNGLEGSADGGTTWSALPRGAMGTPTALAGSGGVWYAWAGGRLWVSRAWAAGWSLAPAQPRAATTVTALAAGSELVVATAASQLGSSDGGAHWTATALARPALGMGEMATAAEAMTQQVPLQPAAAVVDAQGSVLYAAPDGIYGQEGRLPAAPARAFAGLAAAPDGTLYAVAPNGDVYAATAAGRWTLQPAGAVQ